MSHKKLTNKELQEIWEQPRNCGNCAKRYRAFICSYCKLIVTDECKKCHSKNDHQGRRIGCMTICPHCGEVTPAPTTDMLRVHFLRVVDRKPIQEITRILNNDRPPWRRPIKETTVKWLANKDNRIHLCQCCWEWLFPNNQELPVFVNVARGFSFPKTAAKYDMTRYKVVKICKKCREVYFMDYQQIRSDDALARRLIRYPVLVPDAAKFDALLYRRKARNPLEGYKHQREPEGKGPVIPGTDVDDGYRKRYAEYARERPCLPDA